MRAVNPFGYNRNSEKLYTEANIFATYIYKIYYISRNARVYILVDIEYSTYIYTHSTHACLRTHVDIKSCFCKIGYRTLLRQMSSIIIFIILLKIRISNGSRVIVETFLCFGKCDERCSEEISLNISAFS